LTLSLLLTLTIGSGFYMLVEGWSVLDAVYFSVVTLATVGYGDLSPTTAPGKLFTIAYIVAGIGLLAGFANAVARRWVDHRLRRVSMNQSVHVATATRRAPRRVRRSRRPAAARPESTS
jgi:voltage-gated potassium channel